MRSLRSSIVGLTLLATLPASQVHAFHHDAVLGTSLDLILTGVSAQDARVAEAAMFAEIDRLCSILSTYDAQSEISEVMAGRSEVRSKELAELLTLYRQYGQATGGAISLDVKGRWNVDALGKGYVIDRCVELLQKLAPGGLLNIGGDLRAWGPHAFPVRIADPENFSDNAPGLGLVFLQDAAIASSGSYLRPGHLLDPRTGQPVPSSHAATVTAGTCVEANAWSTALCVEPTLAMPAGVSYVRPIAMEQATVATQTASSWPAGFQVKIGVNIKTPPPGERAKKPYVAVWIEDEKGKVIRNLALWGDEEKYWPEMTAWWKAIGGDRGIAAPLASATRRPGEYTLTWDGKDSDGNFVPQGKYRVRLEVNREHGNHVRPSLGITCGEKSATVSFKPTAETDASNIEYGPASASK